jgi:hypothetical protein
VDRASYSSRYPTDKEFGASLEAHFRFNVPEFCGVLDELLPVFDGAATAAHEWLQAEYEARAEGGP